VQRAGKRRGHGYRLMFRVLKQNLSASEFGSGWPLQSTSYTPGRQRKTVPVNSPFFKNTDQPPCASPLWVTVQPSFVASSRTRVAR
jgi:hypothetical protein